jgi:hypothetical protein
MTSKTRLKQIQKKLKIGENNYPLTYWTFLCVDENKPFEEITNHDRKDFSILNSGFVNVNKGKEFLGKKALEKLPMVKQKIKKIYEEQQAEIKNDPKVGGSLVFLSLKEGVDT